MHFYPGLSESYQVLPHRRKTNQLLSHLLSFCAWQCNSLRITCGIITGCQNELASSLNTGKWFNDIHSYLLEGLVNHRYVDHLGPIKIFTVTLLTCLAPMAVISFISKNLWPVVATTGGNGPLSG